MRVGNLNHGAAKLIEALENLELAWEESTTKWKDETSHNFEKHHLKPLKPAVKMALDAINRLDEVLARACRDCEG